MSQPPILGLSSQDVATVDDLILVRRRARDISRFIGLGIQDQVQVTAAVSALVRELVVTGSTVSVSFSLNRATVIELVVTVRWSGPRSSTPDDTTTPWTRLGELGRRLSEVWSLAEDAEHGQAVLATKLPVELAKVEARVEQIRRRITRSVPPSPWEDLRSHDHELLAVLAILRERHEQLRRTNLELDETNRGVVALYAELEEVSAQLRDTAHILQRAMLSEPPTVAGVDICVRYRPATASDEAGGDWYDVFELPDGDLAVVVGDVAGHDIHAAATMGQLRAILRGLAYHSNDEQPHQVLRSLDRVARGMKLTSFTTAIFGRLSAASRTLDTSMSWSNAGHPGFVVLGPGQPPALVDMPRDLPLGVDHRAPRSVAHRVILPGSTLLLFSDGLFERRDELINESLAELVARAGAHQDRPLEDLCDQLLARAPVDDDLVLVALRLANR